MIEIFMFPLVCLHPQKTLKPVSSKVQAVRQLLAETFPASPKDERLHIAELSSKPKHIIISGYIDILFLRVRRYLFGLPSYEQAHPIFL